MLVSGAEFFDGDLQDTMHAPCNVQHVSIEFGMQATPITLRHVLLSTMLFNNNNNIKTIVVQVEVELIENLSAYITP